MNSTHHPEAQMITVSTWPLQNTNHRVNAVPGAGYKFPAPQAVLRRGPVAVLRRGPEAVLRRSPEALVNA
jgi:hypothetical protein